MRRRNFISLVGGAAVAWPLAARAQQPDRMRRIVYMHALAENDPEEQVRIAAFRQGLETLGWTDNRNIQIEHRYSGGDFTRIQAHAAEVVSSAPDLIVAVSTPVLMALKAGVGLECRFQLEASRHVRHDGVTIATGYTALLMHTALPIGSLAAFVAREADAVILLRCPTRIVWPIRNDPTCA